MKTTKLVSIIVLAVLIATCLIALLVVSNPTANSKVVKFEVGENTLVGNYTEVENSQYAVLLCGGFSSDRQMMRPFANLFVSSGISTMTFDYSGHGSSTGTVGFDNATNGQITSEINGAIAYLKQLTGLDSSHIILLGHSMGGRCLLEMLIGSNETFNHVLLLSPQINYDNNTQSSAFTGVTDSEIEPWASLDSSAVGGNKISLVGSYHDDIVSVESINEIYNRLSDDGTNNAVTLNVVSGVLHSYEVYSVKVANVVFDELNSVCAMPKTANLAVTYIGWIAIAVFVLALLVLLASVGSKTQGGSLELVSFKQFILRKMLLWLPALVAMALIACVAVVLPIGAPIMSIVFIGGIAGYGITMLIFYKLGKIKGVVGKLTVNAQQGDKGRNTLQWAIMVVAVAVVMATTLASGMYNLFPLNARLIWLVLASGAMSVGFYVSNNEAIMLERANVKWWQSLLYNLSQYTLLFLVAVAYLFIESYSGLIGMVQSLTLMYISIYVGKFVSKRSNNVVASVVVALLFQWFTLTSTCLMTVF